MPDHILISIHPQHTESILSGEKYYEFRKSAPKGKLTRAFIYSTHPVSRIVAIAEVSRVISGSPTAVWQKTRHGAGISKSHFFEYFKDREHAYAIEIAQVSRYKEPVDPRAGPLKLAIPQSYRYIKEKELHLLNNRPTAPSSTFLVFLGGPHGAGKTTIGKALAQELGFFHTSASQLIKIGGGEVRQDKTVTKLKTNQEILTQGISLLTQNHRRIALDGHFCLISTEGSLSNIELETYRKLGINAIIHLSLGKATLAKRLATRPVALPANLNLDKYLLNSQFRAQEIAKAMNVPLLHVKTSQKPASCITKIKAFLVPTYKCAAYTARSTQKPASPSNT
jgi:predicted transcriptional regulator/shikimate kinase